MKREAMLWLAFFANMLGALVLDNHKALRREGINRTTRVELQQYLGSSAANAIMPLVIFLDVIQKGDSQRIDGYGADGHTCLLWIGVADCPFSNAPGIVLGCFGGAEFAEIDSFSVDTDEGCASVVSHLGRTGM